jgi:hypothetical protein
MRTIEDYFASSVDKSLYQYTSIGALLGIVQSRSVWASHIYYVNDSREIIQACTVLDAVLDQKEMEFEGDEREFIKQFQNWLPTFQVTPYHLFVFPLSEERSLLSQWRGYTPHGKGVSLGFSAAGLNHILRTPGFRIAKCLYDQREHVEVAFSLVDKMIVTLRQRLATLDVSQHHPTQRFHGLLEEFRGDLLQVLSIIKHAAFAEEREWRIVSTYFPKYTVPEIKFREGASMLLPYIEMALPNDCLLFDEVILGPTEHNNLSAAALSTYLSNKKVCNKTVSSGIPYRQW